MRTGSVLTGITPAVSDAAIELTEVLSGCAKAQYATVSAGPETSVRNCGLRKRQKAFRDQPDAVC